MLDALVRLVVDWSSSSGTQATIARVADLDVDPADIRALFVLGLEGECRLGALAEALRQSAPTTSKQFLRLHRRGLVAKRDDPADSRAKLFALTPKGEAATDALNDVTLRRVAHALREVSDPDQFADQLRRFTTALLAEV